MFSQENRSLRRPLLGAPDVYAQKPNQKEVRKKGDDHDHE